MGKTSRTRSSPDRGHPVKGSEEMSRSRVFLFKLILVLLPLILLGLIELGLRVAGSGKEIPLFVEDPENADFLRMNSQVARRYFIDPKAAPAVSYPSFRKEKNDSTFRVVVQGASTVAGIPYKHGGSFPAMLEYRLQASMPRCDVEVVNTAITAVCSYTLLDEADEIIGIEPDAVIIYAGHNEYYGVLGAGSSQRLGTSGGLVRFYLKAGGLRLVQLMKKVHGSLVAGRTSEIISRPNSTLMERMVRENEIPYGSKLYRRGVAQFKENLTRLARKYHKHNIPLFICTLASNQKDLPPFISDTGKEENNARFQYELGCSLFLDSAYEQAARHFQLASDLDLLRFRAPSEFNGIIGVVSREEGAEIIDVEQVFRNHSPGGIIGTELMTEHVHPTIQGYFLVADACYRKLYDSGLAGQCWKHFISTEEARAELPVTVVDSLYGLIGIRVLKDSWPFTGRNARKEASGRLFIPGNRLDSLALDLFNERISWGSAMNQLYRYYLSEGDYSGALSVARALQVEMNRSAIPYNMAARAYTELGYHEAALQALYRGFETEPLPEVALNLGRTLIAEGQLEAALPYLERSRGNEQLAGQADKLMGSIQEILRLEKEIRAHADSTELLLYAAYHYLLLDRRDIADSLVSRAYRQDPGNATLGRLISGQ